MKGAVQFGLRILPDEKQSSSFQIALTTAPLASTATAAAEGTAAPPAVTSILASIQESGDVTHFKSERGIGLLIESACSRSSVLAFACAESRVSYIGVHGNLEKNFRSGSCCFACPRGDDDDISL